MKASIVAFFPSISGAVVAEQVRRAAIIDGISFKYHGVPSRLVSIKNVDQTSASSSAYVEAFTVITATTLPYSTSSYFTSFAIHLASSITSSLPALPK